MRYADSCVTLALLSLLTSLGVIGADINVTMDDSDPSILYQPQESWLANPEHCPTCPYPAATLAFNNSYHYGIHNVDPDTDDFAHTTGTSNTAKGRNDRAQKGEDHAHDQKSKSMRQEMQRLDSDDPGFVDSAVTAQFNFTGTAVYLFCIEPLAISSSLTTSTIMNLTFILDNTLSGSFVYLGSSSGSGFASNVPVLSLEDINNGPHVLLVNVLPDSVFAFDYLVYTVDHQLLSSTSTSSTTIPTTASKSTKNMNHRNIGTFAGAVGGSVGVLGTLALCLFISIWTRRRRSAKRERLEQARERELASAENTPPIIGPAPFIPRYFPRVGPAAPPPYVGPSHNIRDTSFFHTSSPPSPINPNLPPFYRVDVNPAASAHPLSYADIPPSTPPPPSLEETASLEAHWIALPPSPPPPFGGTIANSATTPDASDMTSHHEADIPILSSTNVHNLTTLTASRQQSGIDIVTDETGIPPSSIAPG